MWRVTYRGGLRHLPHDWACATLRFWVCVGVVWGVWGGVRCMCTTTCWTSQTTTHTCSHGCAHTPIHIPLSHTPLLTHNTGSGLLLGNYVLAAAMALQQPAAFRVPLMLGAHAVLGVLLIWQTLKLDSAKYTQAAIAGYYRFIWNLFYTEYAMFPFL